MGTPVAAGGVRAGRRDDLRLDLGARHQLDADPGDLGEAVAVARDTASVANTSASLSDSVDWSVYRL
jgi:hypothetical protein